MATRISPLSQTHQKHPAPPPGWPADFEALLTKLDAIPFPSSAKDDVSALKKTVVALQVFWSNVSIDDSSYSAFTYGSLLNGYDDASILLGHDVGVSLVIEKPSRTPS